MKAIFFWLAITLHACFIFQALGQSVRELKYSDGSVWVTGLDEKVAGSVSDSQWKDILRVYTQEAFNKKLNQSISGTYVLSGDRLMFKPDFEFVAGASYHCVFAWQNNKLELSFSTQEERFPLTKIESVHPKGDVLPENALRMYIYFSSPMMPGEAYDHIVLLTEDGKTVEKAFLVIDAELWDSERKRFTLLFDPGRVKRGIRSNKELGSPLREGQKYSLIIDSTWRDANGNFLEHTYKKLFVVSAAQRTKLSTSGWNVIAPTAGTGDPVTIEFDRSIDYALALKFILVTATPSGTIEGEAALIGSKHWQFTPDRVWSPGEYHIEIHPLIEDVAGNNFNNAFDIDLSKVKRVNSAEPVKISFFIEEVVR